MYDSHVQEEIIHSLSANKIESLITVSNDLQSAKVNLTLANKHNTVKPAFGFHPEQALPTSIEMKELYQFIQTNHRQMIAIGEVGLPYYLKRNNTNFNLHPYVEMLEKFIILASKYQKPVILHAIYEDAEVTCDLLEKHNVTQAHFHWFKGNREISDRLARAGYFISVTPDILYEKEIETLVENFPLQQLMVETDGPWQFTGPFKDKLTHPKMIHDVIDKIALVKNQITSDIYNQIYQNTIRFYNLNKYCIR